MNLADGSLAEQRGRPQLGEQLMSMTDTPTDPEEEAAQTVEEKRDLFERLAEADLPISEDLERVLEIFDGGDEE